MAGLSADEQIQLYRLLLRIRLFEEEAVRVYLTGEMPGFIHAYLGEEAVAAGVCFNLQTEDYVTSTHRGHGHCVGKGASFEGMMAELFAREGGCNRGRGGSMHIADFSRGILGANGIVAAGIPIAVGAGLAIQMQKRPQVVVSFFGDGATNHGNFHESLNLASIWNLPLVFVCENNQYAISVPKRYHQKIGDIALRAASYGIPGVAVDGNDVLAVYEAAREAVNRARRGEGPSLLVCDTYRHSGHYVGDPANYRTKEEEAEWKKKDPVVRYERYLLSSKALKEEEAGRIRGEIMAELHRALEFARKSPRPSPKDVFRYVYAEGVGS